MQHPNFLQVSNGLRDARVLCDRPGAGAAVRSYASRLDEMIAAFGAANSATDAEHRDWRLLIGAELKALKGVRVALELTRSLADEHGFDDVPNRTVVYTEREDMLGLVNLTVAWLKGIQAEWPWAGAQIDALGRAADDARAATKTAENALARYRVAVKARVAAYGAAVSLLREFVRDASNDAALRGAVEPVAQSAGA